MPDLETIAKQPNYDAAASGASKTTIFVFIVTFGYLVFFSGVSSGFIGGIAFVIIGMFVVSLVISMPLFLLKSKFPKIAILSSIIDIGVTVFVTRAAYLLIFSQAGVAAELAQTGAEQPPHGLRLAWFSVDGRVDERDR